MSNRAQHFFCSVYIFTLTSRNIWVIFAQLEQFFSLWRGYRLRPAVDFITYTVCGQHRFICGIMFTQAWSFPVANSQAQCHTWGPLTKIKLWHNEAQATHAPCTGGEG